MKKLFALVAGTALIFSLAACGGGDSGGAQSGEGTTDAPSANATQLKLVASNYEFDQEEYRVKAGEPIEFALENAEGYHEYEVVGTGISIKPGQPQQYTFDEPGEYEIICSIFCGPGHDDMVATLIVE